MDDKPVGFQNVTPFLLVARGDDYIAFAQRAFGATTRSAHHDAERLVHAELELHGCMIELGTPAGDFTPTTSAFHVYVSDPDGHLARAVEAGCEVLYPVADQPYGERSGGVRDPWGNHWYFARVIDHAKRQS